MTQVAASSAPAPSRLNRWLPVLLALPACLPLINAYVEPLWHGLVPTGFVQYDMACYMANARQHFSNGFHFTYSNPFAGFDSPAVYFQPQILVLGLLEHLGFDPATCINIFWFGTLIFATAAATLLYRQLVGLDSTAKRLGLVCFFWGGGVFVFTGLAWELVKGHLSLNGLFHVDPAGGWWMLNFGRNLIYPTEAYYHGLFLLSLFCLVQKRTFGALLCSAILSISHPFTGVTLALVLVAYSALELMLKSRAASPTLLIGACLITVAHFGYYSFFLGRFPEHRAVQAQFALPWLYRPAAFLPGLFFVAILAGLRMWRWPGLRTMVKEPVNRLMILLFVIVFGLSHHNLLIKPVQPIHFAHGYDWMALFFLGAPLLIAAIERMLSIPSKQLRVCAVGTLVGLLLLDNLVWLGSFVLPLRDPPIPLEITQSEKSVLDWLNSHALPRSEVVSEDSLIGYLVSVYTPDRSWFGHWCNTPFAAKREQETTQAFQDHKILPEWTTAPTYFVAKRADNWHPPANFKELYENADFAIFGPGGH